MKLSDYALNDVFDELVGRGMVQANRPTVEGGHAALITNVLMEQMQHCYTLHPNSSTIAVHY